MTQIQSQALSQSITVQYSPSPYHGEETFLKIYLLKDGPITKQIKPADSQTSTGINMQRWRGVTRDWEQEHMDAEA